MPSDLHSSMGLTRRVVLWAAGIGLLGDAARAAPAPAGSVENVRGEGYVEAVERRFLSAAAPVFVGDLVCTGRDSQLGLMLGLRTKIKLGADARLKIDRFLPDIGGELVLERGALRAAHEAGENVELSVKSPFGLLVVRGTEFFAGPIDGMFGVFVERGVVAVTGGNKTVSIPANSGTIIERAGAEPSNPAPWGAARLAQARALVD